MLAATSPKSNFYHVRRTAARIIELETQLSLTRSPLILNAAKAEKRIAELEAMATASEPPEVAESRRRIAADVARLAAESTSAPVVASPAAPIVEKHGAELFCANVRVAGLKSSPLDPNSKLTGRERFKASILLEGQTTTQK